jgi:hypothetical protein
VCPEVSSRTLAALLLALTSTILTNLAYAREHDAAARMQRLTLRSPLRSLRLLFSDRSWVGGFLLEGGGFALYALALALGSLALVQSVAAGGIGILAWVTARRAGRELSGRELAGVGVSCGGLLLLAISLSRASGEGGGGGAPAIGLWLLATAVVAGAVLGAGAFSWLGPAAARGLAGGLMFSIGDISTKVATGGGVRLLFLVTLVLGYLAGTALLQSGYQSGGAVRVAGLATLTTNALPIAAGGLLLGEPVPSGVLGVVRSVAFAAVVVGAFLLATPGSEGRPIAAKGRPRAA